MYQGVHDASRFSQSFDYQPDLCRSKAPGGVRKADGTKVVHQVRIVVNPKHQFLSRGSRGDVRAIELGQLSFAVGSYFHFCFLIDDFHLSKIQKIRLTTNYLAAFIAPYRSSSFRFSSYRHECCMQGFAVLYLCCVIRRITNLTAGRLLILSV